jgi:hypothetical protein
VDAVSLTATFRNAVSCAVISKKEDAESSRQLAGLCASCACARRVESSRGSLFFLCERSATDPRFAKYPRLPVQACAGYAKRSEAKEFV